MTDTTSKPKEIPIWKYVWIIVGVNCLVWAAVGFGIALN